MTDAERERGLRAVVRDGVTTQTMVTLTGGAFLVAFAVHLGANNFVIGLLAALPPLLHLLQIPSIYLVERVRLRRLITVLAALLGRLSFFLVLAIPFLGPGKFALAVLLVTLAVNATGSAVATCSWNSWMRDLVPTQTLGTFFSRRLAVATLIAIPFMLVSGFVVDAVALRAPLYTTHAYVAVFSVGAMAGLVGVFFIASIPEPLMRPPEGRPHLGRMFRAPFGDLNFRRLILFLGTWNFAIHLAAPFFAIYMLRQLGLPVSFVVGMVVLTQLLNVLSFRMWGRFSDRYSHKTTLAICGPLFLGAIFAWTFTTFPDAHALTIPLVVLIHVASGIATAGVTLASGNIGLKLAPQGQATSYLAAASLVNSLAAGSAPILGGLLADFFAVRELSFRFSWRAPEGVTAFDTLSFQGWDFFFGIAFVIGIYSLHRLALVREEGSIDERFPILELVGEARREMQNLTSVGGLRLMIMFPFWLMRAGRRKKRPDPPLVPVAPPGAGGSGPPTAAPHPEPDLGGS